MSGVGVGFVEVYLDPGNRFRREAGELEEATATGKRKRSGVSGFLNGHRKSAFRLWEDATEERRTDVGIFLCLSLFLFL